MNYSLSDQLGHRNSFFQWRDFLLIGLVIRLGVVCLSQYLSIRASLSCVEKIIHSHCLSQLAFDRFQVTACSYGDSMWVCFFLLRKKGRSRKTNKRTNEEEWTWEKRRFPNILPPKILKDFQTCSCGTLSPHRSGWQEPVILAGYTCTTGPPNHTWLTQLTLVCEVIMCSWTMLINERLKPRKYFVSQPVAQSVFSHLARHQIGLFSLNFVVCLLSFNKPWSWAEQRAVAKVHRSTVKRKKLFFLGGGGGGLAKIALSGSNGHLYTHRSENWTLKCNIDRFGEREGVSNETNSFVSLGFCKLLQWPQTWRHCLERRTVNAGPPPPLKAILVIVGRRALTFFFVWKLLEKNEKWHHFCAHAQWRSPWRRKNVEKEHLAPSNLTFLLIAIDRNGFRRMKEEGQIYRMLPQIF